MIVAPYQDFPFLVPTTFYEFFAIVQRAFLETNIPTVAPSPTYGLGRYGQPLRTDRSRSYRQTHCISVTDFNMVSLSFSLSASDESSSPLSPLVALETLAEPTEQHFYWEKQDVGDAIAAVGCLVEQRLVGPHSGGDRFVQTQKILDKWFTETAVIGPLELPFTGPHAFCRFTFFDQALDGTNNHPFPPASVFIPKWHIGQHHHQTVFVANVARTDHHTGKKLPLKQQCLDLWHIYQHLRQPITTSTALPFVSLELNPALCTTAASPPDPTGPSTSGPSTVTMMSSIPTPESLLGKERESDHPTSPWSSTKSLGLHHIQKEEFKQSVQAALEVIESTDLTKAVLAQVFDVSVDTSFQVFPSLHNLRASHGDCHVFSTANGQGQVFLGASPERLLSIRNRTLYTEAIAGSAPRGTTPEADETLGNTLLCNIKELHEHQLVVNYITQQLTQLNLEPQRSPFPKLLQLANIQHLHTPIFAKLPANLSALDIVGHLHPTPAVAGVPQDMACGLIQEQESFERSLYAAPIGWINYQGDSEFIVGIRSALLDGHTARLYAGAGIVRGSQPELEVSEIELKLQALLTTLLF